MKKAVSSIFEFVGFVCSLIGIIGLFGSASEIIYRQRPSTGFIIQGEEFHTMINNENDKLLVAQLVAANVNYMMDKDLDAVNGLTQMIREYPDYIKGYYFRGLIYLSAGRVEDGVTDMQTVIKQSGDPQLRQQASKEIVLARLAQVLTPIPFLGLAGAAMLFISNWARLKFSSWGRSIKMLLIAACILWATSFIFLLLH